MPEWVSDAVFYQIFPDRFARASRAPELPRLEAWDDPPTRHGFKGGDLLGIAERLDHLERLGVDAIWLNPIFASASNHRYHTYDYHAVDPLLGGDDAFRTLLDRAHERGIRVVLDGVFNHASRGFWPFHHALETGPSSPYWDWFHIERWPIRPYDTSRSPEYDAWWGLHALPAFDISNPDVREFLLEVAERWTRIGVDGWRLDVPDEIDDPTFWQEFRRRVRAVRPDAYLVGEIWHEGVEWLAGDRFDGLMNYPLARLAAGLCARRIAPGTAPGGRAVEPMGAARALAELDRLDRIVRPEVARARLNLLSSHDTSRFLTQASGDHEALWLAALLVMTLPGAPCIYYGDEVGLEGGPDPDCRRAFPWDESRWHVETYDVFRRAIALRRRQPALRRGSFEAVGSRPGVIAYLRRTDTAAILVVLNTSLRVARTRWRVDAPLTSDPVELWDFDAEPARIDREADGDRFVRVDVGPRSGRVLSLG